MPTLNEQQRGILAYYLREYANAMQLRDWTLHIAYESPQEAEHGAESEVKAEMQSVRIKFREDLPETTKDDPGDMRRLLVHELAHCYFGKQRALTAESFGQLLGLQLSLVLQGILQTEEEAICEAIAQSLAPHLPEFSWQPKAKK